MEWGEGLTRQDGVNEINLSHKIVMSEYKDENRLQTRQAIGAS